MADGAALEAFWLPDLGEFETIERAFGPAHVGMRVPEIRPRFLREAVSRLRDRQRRILARRPIDSILKGIGAAAGRLTDPAGVLHGELLERLPGLTGYSREMIALGLERMAAGWRADALRGALEGELGEAAVLDEFRARRPRGRHRAYGPELCVHVFAGNIPGIAVTSLIRALCVKSASLGKLAAGEPYLSVCFARALAAEDAELASCLAVLYWPGGSEELEAVAFSEAEAVIAYGGDETIATLACRVPPQVRFLGYPNRVGAGLISRAALRKAGLDDLAERAARDVVTFDQQGCVSPHVLFIERGGEAEAAEFARRLAGALERLAREIPRGVMTPGESAMVHEVRAQAEVAGAAVLASAGGTGWTVILEEGSRFEPSPLNRVIRLQLVESLTEALVALEPVGRDLQTVALEAEPREVDDLAARLGAGGATRIVPLGEAAWPAPHWHHDGRFQFLDLLRYVDLDV